MEIKLRDFLHRFYLFLKFAEMNQPGQHFFLLFAFLEILFCSIPTVQAQQYSFSYLSAADGLSSSSINSVYNDSRGYTWLGTVGGGLCRYNGESVSTYTKTEGLVGNNVNCITEDKQGNIWIGTTDGVSKFDGKNFTSYTTKNGLKLNSTYSIAIGFAGEIYIASDGGGIAIYDQNKFNYLGKKEGLPTDTVYALATDSKGILWIGLGSRGLVSFDGKTIKRFSHFPELCRNTYFALYCDYEGNTWMGSYSGLLFRIYGNKIESIELPSTFKGHPIFTILKDKWGALWVASSAGLLKYSEKKAIQINKNNGLSSDYLTCLNSDIYGNVWIGTFDAGVSIFTNNPITKFNEKSGFENVNINVLLTLNDSALLIGTGSPGLNKLLANKLSKIKTNSSLDQSVILAIIQDNNKQYIIGTELDGVFYLDKNFNFIKQVKEINGTPLKSITQLLVNSSNDLYIATYGFGLFVIDSVGNKKSFKSSNSGLATDDILSIYFSTERKILLGLFAKGLMEFDGTIFKPVKLATALDNISVNSIVGDNNGRCFIGTREEGVFLLEKEKMKKVSKSDGLCSNFIGALYWDGAKNKLWLGTNKGVNALQFSAKNTVEKIDFIGQDKGLSNTEVTRGCLTKTNNGLIWIGTFSGLFNYDVNQEKTLGVIPEALLNEVLLFNKETDWSKYADSLNYWNKTPLNLNLNYNENQLLFRFSAPGSEKNRVYQYMIQGYDKEWSPSLRNNEAIYSSLPPGTNYIFKVRLVNTDGKTGPETTFTFSITPPFWKTWWFYTLVGSGLLLGLFSYIRYRERLLLQEKKHLEEKVVERTTELKHTNERLSEAFTDIKDSINYAQSIQKAILPMESIIHEVLPDSFILFKPRDVVSGDFYWFGTVEKNGNMHHIIAAADCTGHGVPGAFMSMIGNTILSEIVIAKEIVDPSKILSLLHLGIRRALKQNLTTSRDGMDICLCAIDLSTNKVMYSGANNPLWILRKDNSIEIIKANKFAIGGFTEDNQVFISHEVLLQKGETIYLFTDGYADQFGGEHGKKLTAKKFRETIIQVADKSMSQQKFHLENFVEIWKGKEFQVDDILVIGVRA